MFTATGKVLVRELPEREIPSVAGIESEQCTAALARRWSWFDEGRELVGSKSES
jgi:hypothetical protein